MIKKLLFLLVLATCCSRAFSQSTSASLTGLVDDPSKALIPGATITAINTQTGDKASTTTNRSGQHVLPGLTPGTYRIEVDKQGFKGIIEAGLVLHVQDAVQINFHMAVGSSSESVTVNASQNNINTTDGTVSTVIDQSYIANMPLNGRSFQDLILLTPGIVTVSPQGNGFSSGNGQTGEFSVNGQRTESNNYTVDGVSANVGVAPGQGMLNAGASGSLPASTALGTTQALVSVDDLQEFRVQSSTYSAQYGRNPGGQFAFETKSGANQWHGSTYEYLRNDLFDANDWFNDYLGVKEPGLRQNDFGGTVGGAVRLPRLYDGRNRTFFFVSYEGLRLTSPQPASVSYVPDMTLRSATLAPLNQVLNAFRVSNGPEVLVPCDPSTDPSCPFSGQEQDGFAEFIGSWSNPSSLNSTSVRFDHVVSDRLTLFFRFSDTTSSSASRQGGQPSTLNNAESSIRTYTAGATSMFFNLLNNDFRLNYSSNGANGNTLPSPIAGASPINLGEMLGLPNVTVGVDLCYDNYCPQLAQGMQSGAQQQWNIVDTASFATGRHQVKFGADYRRLTPQVIPYSPVVYYFYFDEPSVQTNSAYTYGQLNGSAYPLYTNLSLFVQDEWKYSRRLSLSSGLRWELNPPPSVTQGLMPYTFVGTSPANWTLGPQGTPLWHTTWFNIAPRLGAAYILHTAPGLETVLRGGGGVFFDTGQQLGSEGFFGPGFNSSTDFLSGEFPEVPSIPAIQNPPVPPYNSLQYGFSPHLQLPYTIQWNASVEQVLGKSQSFSVSYVGSHGSRLLRTNAYNPPANPNVTSADYFDNGLTSDYNAVQGKFQRRITNGLTALVSFTLSHCIDYGSEYLNAGYERGDCDFDVRRNLSAAASYDLPAIGGSGFWQGVLNRWGLDTRVFARTGFPVTLNGISLVQPDGKTNYTGLNLVPGQPTYIYGAQCASVYADLFGSTLGCP